MIKKFKLPISLLGLAIIIAVAIVSSLGLIGSGDSNLAFVSQFKSKSCYAYQDILLLENEQKEINDEIRQLGVEIDRILNLQRGGRVEKIAEINAEIARLKASLTPGQIRPSGQQPSPLGQPISLTEDYSTQPNQSGQLREDYFSPANSNDRIMSEIRGLELQLELLKPASLTKQMSIARRDLNRMQNQLTRNRNNQRVSNNKLCKTQDIENVTLTVESFTIPSLTCYTQEVINSYSNILSQAQATRRFAISIIGSENTKIQSDTAKRTTAQASLDRLNVKNNKTRADQNNITRLTAQIESFNQSISVSTQKIARLNSNLNIAMQRVPVFETTLNQIKGTICPAGVSDVPTISSTVNPGVVSPVNPKPVIIPECGTDYDGNQIEPTLCSSIGAYICGPESECPNQPDTTGDECIDPSEMGWKINIFGLAGNTYCGRDITQCARGAVYVQDSANTSAFRDRGEYVVNETWQCHSNKCGQTETCTKQVRS